MNFTAVITEFSNINANMIKNLSATSLNMIYYMIMIDITLTFLFVEEEGLNVLVKLMRKILVYGFFIYIINDFANIVETILDGFIQLGNLASIGSTSTDLLVTPGQFFKDLLGFISSIILLSSPTIGLDALPMVSIESVPTVVLFFAFLLAIGALFIGIEITVSFIKFFIVTATTIILMPFGAFQKTQDIAMKGLHALLAQGVELMFMVIILNFYDKYKYSIFLPPKVDENLELFTCIESFGIMLLFAFMITKVPAFVSTLLSGSISALGITNSRTTQSIAGFAGRTTASTMASKTFNSYAQNSGGSTEGVKGIENKK